VVEEVEYFGFYLLWLVVIEVACFFVYYDEGDVDIVLFA